MYNRPMEHRRLTVLLVLSDDDAGHGALLLQILLAEAVPNEVTTVAPPRFESALDLHSEGIADVVLFGASFDTTEDLERLEALRQVNPRAPLVAIADTLDRDRAWQVIEAGADDCLLRAELSSAALGRALRYALDHQRTSAALARLERYDPLTGLLAHRALFAVLDRFHRRCRRSGDFSFAVLVVSIVDHGAILRRSGHFVAEELMARVALLLEDAARPGDVVARLGDDGFVLVLPTVANQDEADAVAGRMRQLLLAPMQVRGLELHLGIRTGLALSGPRVAEAAYDGPHDMLGAAVLDSKLSLPALTLASADLN